MVFFMHCVGLLVGEVANQAIGLIGVGQKVGSSLVSGVDRSYADAVRGFRGKESPNNAHEAGFNPVLSNDVVEKDLHCSVVNDDLNWLRFCVVGRTVDIVTPGEVSELLKEEGLLSISARPLGGNMVLLAPVDGECIQEVMDDAKVWVSNTFLSLVPWGVDCVVEERMMWLRCFGLPLHAWNEEVFQ
ncbi:unnamed protein product [Lupinus luteus]|uniref:DUF4283 domain-containing protein n=1 Tax=Lupinus luteus TaxID=3873 RepID=A0AAV1XTZ5_LUPLU